MTNDKKSRNVRVHETINLYGAGGCGINLVSRFKDYASEHGYANVNTVFLDASRSNIADDIPDSNCFIIPNLDGSGKVREKNAKVISDNIPKVIETHKPSKFNVIVFSASGGTGSVFGPLFARELARDGIPQIIIMVGDKDSAISSYNTLRTFKTLVAINKGLNAPIIVSWHKNCEETPPSVVDANIHEVIKQLLIVASGQNIDMDSSDLSNWIYYNRPVPTLKPTLGLLDILDTAPDAKLIGSPTSIINILPDKKTTAIPLVPAYGCNGVLPEQMTGKPESSLAYVISSDRIKDIYDGIVSDNEKYTEIAKNNTSVIEALITQEDKVSDDCLVL